LKTGGKGCDGGDQASYWEHDRRREGRRKKEKEILRQSCLGDVKRVWEKTSRAYGGV
jgi:hypothetical protein